jgi:hypothetical protein
MKLAPRTNEIQAHGAILVPVFLPKGPSSGVGKRRRCNK